MADTTPADINNWEAECRLEALYRDLPQQIGGVNAVFPEGRNMLRVRLQGIEAKIDQLQASVNALAAKLGA